MKFLFHPRVRNEARENLRLALPLVAAQISFVAMGAVDAMMAGQLGPTALASVAVGTNVWFLLFGAFMGLFMAISPIVAHRVGAKQPPAEIGRFIRGSLVFAILAGLLWFGLLHALMRPLLTVLRVDPAIHDGALAYLRVISFATVPFCLCFALRDAAEGCGQTRAPAYVGLSGLATNAVANYVLIYGHLGFPALGAVGTAWGTLFASIVMFVVYLSLYRILPGLRSLQVLRPGWPRLERQTLEVLRLGLPLAAIVVAESWLFSAGALMVAHFGAETVAAHQVAINFAAMMFMVPLSIGMATTIRVGHAMGAGDRPLAALGGRTGILLGASFALLSATLMVLFPQWIVGVYSDAPEVVERASHFLMFAAVFQIFDCVQATSNGALRGLKDTRAPMAITVAAYWLVGMPLAAWLTLRTPIGASGIWIGFIAGLGVAALGLSLRFLRRTRRFDNPESGSVLIT
jgi:MATE family multidrug resistance protein